MAPVPAVWATGTREARWSQAKLAGVALSVQGRIVEPSAKVTRLRFWCRGQPLREAHTRLSVSEFYMSPSSMLRSGTVNFGLLLSFAHGRKQRGQCA